ncbi:MAG: hypothetical protein ABJ239_00545 [Erythrobacter sp.]
MAGFAVVRTGSDGVVLKPDEAVPSHCVDGWIEIMVELAPPLWELTKR